MPPPYDEKCYHSILIYYFCEPLTEEISTDFFDKEELEYADKAEWLDLKKAKTVKFYDTGNCSLVLEKAAKMISQK